MRENGWSKSCQIEAGSHERNTMDRTDLHSAAVSYSPFMPVQPKALLSDGWMEEGHVNQSKFNPRALDRRRTKNARKTMADPSFGPVQDARRLPSSRDERLLDEIEKGCLDGSESGRLGHPVVLLKVDV
jgi:hypothetical protein